MRNKLEQLLNSLIEKGWKPFGEWDKLYVFENGIYILGRYDLRQIVSKESRLWQFVCENHLYIYKSWENKNFIQDHFKNEYNECCYQYLWDKSCYEYYLLESALCDEDKLEEFLLSNIKVEWEK